MQHYNGIEWSAMTSGTGNTIVSLWGTSASSIYAAGASGTFLKYGPAPTTTTTTSTTTTTTTPTTTASPTTTTTAPSSGGLDAGEISLIVMGTIILIVIIAMMARGKSKGR